MAMAARQAQCLQTLNSLAQGSSSLDVRNRPAIVSFTRNVLSHRRNARLVICAAEGGGSCCGGSDNGKQSCSSHGAKAPPPSLAGVGAEFENMVSRSTMQEFEKEYDSGEFCKEVVQDIHEFVKEYDLGEFGKSAANKELAPDVVSVDIKQMQGAITRDVVADVMSEIPELLNGSNEEKFVDVDAVLNEAMSLANEDFVFDSEVEGTMV